MMNSVTPPPLSGKVSLDLGQFLKQLQLLGYSDSDTIFLREIGGGSASKITKQLSQLPQTQTQGKDLYFVVNGQGHSDADIKDGIVFWCEWDDRPLGEQESLWKKQGFLEPTFQVRTRKSIHCYWVLDSRIPISQWSPIQTQLLDALDGDRTLKNPSRVLRVAGSWHYKNHPEPIQCQLINVTGKKYSLQEIQAALPSPAKTPILPIGDGDFTAMPSTLTPPIPLENILPLKYRELIEQGIPQGSRSNTGFSLAKELMAAERHLQWEGVSFSGSAYQLFMDYCRRCDSTDWTEKEWEQIWKSAQRGGAEPTLDSDKIRNCILAWKKKHGDNHLLQVYKPNRERMSDNSEASKKDGDRLKLEVQAYLKETDPFVKIYKKGQICSYYRILGKDLDSLCKFLEAQNSTPQTQVFSLLDFLSQSSEGMSWILPGMLPKGEMALLAAQAKAGKTLLACDVAYAVLTGTRAIGETAKQGKVLLVSSDESLASTRRRLYARGFDLISNPDSFRIMTALDLNDLSTLEAQLEDFRPDLVVIDSLTSVTLHSNISEKDAEFAKTIYKLKDLTGRYEAASILIHHENKSKEAKGIEKVSGSARITAAVWGIWQLSATNPDDEACTKRYLKVKPREGEAVTHILDLNPKDQWASSQIYNYVGEFGDESGEKKSQSHKILQLLQACKGKGLTAGEILEALPEIPKKSLYRACDRLEDRRLITKRRSTTDGKTWVYACEGYEQEEIPNNSDFASIVESEPIQENVIAQLPIPEPEPMVDEGEWVPLQPGETVKRGQKVLHSFFEACIVERWGETTCDLIYDGIRIPGAEIAQVQKVWAPPF
jgi:KaiC/GvpD/RAD55 family RecA-like ATPase